MSDDIAVGTKVFTRTEKLQRMLDEMPEWVSVVYVADDGETTAKKTELYDRSYPFQLEVLELEYDAGLGAGREVIVDALSEDYLLIVDSDHLVPPMATLLRDQLEARPDLGGVGGAIVEPEREQLYCEGQDFVEVPRDGGIALVRGPNVRKKTKEIELVAGVPLVEFDFIPNAALFRRECLEEQSWDSRYVIEAEHVDFYVAHWKRTDWSFAISPGVQFPHFPGGDSEYMLERHDPDKGNKSREYFFEKWGYEADNVRGWNWLTTAANQSDSEHNVVTALGILHEEGPIALARRIRFYITNHVLD